MAKKSKYGSLADSGAVDAGKEQVERKSGGGILNIGDKKFWKPKTGKTFNLFDIIPYEVTVNNHPMGIEPGQLYQQLKYKVHRNIGAENKTVICPGTIGERCPICEARSVLARNYNANKDECDALKAKDRIAFNIIDLNDEDAGIQIFDMSPYNFANKLYEEIDIQECRSCFDLVDGFTVKARFTEEKFDKTSFPDCSRVDFDERDPYDDSIVGDTVDLDSAMNIMEYGQLEKMFLELEDEPGEKKPGKSSAGKRRQEEEEDESSSRSSRRGKQTQPKEDADDGEEDGEDEEKPSGRRGKGKPETKEKPVRRGRPKPGDEEPEDEEPEDEEPPQKSPRRERQKPEKKGSTEKCPAGLKFGVDCEKHDDCDICDTEVWEKCREAADNM